MSRFEELKKRLKKAKESVSDSFFVDKIQAYKKLFSGTGDKRDADIVLNDLIQAYDVKQPAFKNHLTTEQIANRSIIREPILRIIKFIEYSNTDIQELTNNINKNRIK